MESLTGGAETFFMRIREADAAIACMITVDRVSIGTRLG